MGNYEDWAELRMFLIEAFNGTIPTPQAETDIIAAYELHPGTLEKIAVDIAGQYASGGDITSPWGLLHYKAGKINTPPSNPSRPSSVTREKALARADQWLHNAGCHHDETEAILHLCDTNGLLSSYAQAELVNDGPGTPARLETSGDTTILQHIRERHQLEHPRGQAADQAALARAETWKNQRAKEPPRTRSTSPNSAKPSPPTGKASQPPTSSPSSTPSKPPTPTSPPTNNPTTATPTTSSAPSPASSPNLENTPL
jgi:hypothetical protein